MRAVRRTGRVNRLSSFCKDCPHDGRCLDSCYRLRYVDPGQFDIEWLDGARDPSCLPNPKYPKGIDIDASLGAAKSCTLALPYPAKRIGAYVATCRVCGFRAGCTTAGRPDDPRSITVPCRTGGSLINFDRVMVKPS